MEITVSALEAYLKDHYQDPKHEQSLFMKLVEEMGEVAEVLNKRAHRKASREGENLDETLGTELADVIHYAVAIAAVNGLDLTRILLEKDKKAAVKYGHSMDLETFLNNR